MTNMASYHSTLPHSEAHLDEQSALGTIDPSSILKDSPSIFGRGRLMKSSIRSTWLTSR